MIAVAKHGEEMKEIAHREGMTVTDALREADITTTEKEDTISVNNEPVKNPAETELADENIVVVTPKPKNG